MAQTSWSPVETNTNMFETSAESPPVSETESPPVSPTREYSTSTYASMPVIRLREFTEKPAVNLRGTELVTVRVKTAGQGLNTGTDTFKDQVIPKLSAVCRFCFYKFVENDDNEDVLRTYCNCGYSTLTHRRCAIDWGRKKGNYRCEKCNQDTRFLRVAILSTKPATANSSAAGPAAVNQERKNFRPQFLQRRRRWW